MPRCKCDLAEKPLFTEGFFCPRYYQIKCRQLKFALEGGNQGVLATDLAWNRADGHLIAGIVYGADEKADSTGTII